MIETIVHIGLVINKNILQYDFITAHWPDKLKMFIAFFFSLKQS